MLFSLKSKEKAGLPLSVVGAAIGFFLLSPLVFYVLQPLQGSGKIFSSLSTFNLPWSFLLIFAGTFLGLGAGYFYSVYRVKKYQVEEVKPYLELVINSMGEKISIVDPKKQIILCNDSYAQSVSGTTASLRGKSYLSLASYNSTPNICTDDACIVAKTFKTGMPQAEIERESIDGQTVVVEKKTYPMKGRTGKTINCVIVENDISRQRQLEDTLRQAQKMEAIGTLAGGIAHDFNNILGSVIGYADLGLIKTPKNDQVHKYLRAILKAGIRGKDLTEQILAFSRKKPIRKKPVVVSEIIQEALKLLRASMPSTIKIRTKIVAKNARILADSTQIHQVLMNLCTNANYAMEDKVGVLGVQLQVKKIGPKDAAKIGGLEPGQFLYLSVSDTGHGIEKSVLPRIFDPFFTTKRDQDGTGMGLSVVHGITKSCNGGISVTSKIGKGTTFHLLFPLLEEFAETEEQVSPARCISKGKGTVMVVDDEKELVMMLEEMLIFLGYQVDPVTSSLEALKKFQEKPAFYDLVITDYTMPEKTGFELAKDMLAIRADMPIILTSGYTDTITPQDAIDAGVTEFLLKPLHLQDVADTIKSATCVDA